MNYVYVYERLGIPLYVGLGSDKSLSRARDIRSGHADFYAWCKTKFGGIGRVTIRIVANNLTKTQARLLESVLICEHARHHDIFNRVVSIKTADHYVARYRKARRYSSDAARAAAKKESQRKSNAARLTSPKSQQYERLKKIWMAEFGQKYYQLSNKISYAKKVGKSYDHLLKERASVPTFSQWTKARNP